MSTLEEELAFALGIRAASFGAGDVPDLEPNEVCGIEGCTRLATDHWSPAVCALREADVSVDWVAVCAEHDVELNEHTVRFFFGTKYDEALADYRGSRLTPLRGETERTLTKGLPL